MAVRTEEHKQSLILEYHLSGLTQAAFCRKKKISQSTLHGWLNKTKRAPKPKKKYDRKKSSWKATITKQLKLKTKEGLRKLSGKTQSRGKAGASHETVRRYIRKTGLRSYIEQKKPILTETNKQKRLKFSREWVSKSHEGFIWADESTVRMGQGKNRVWARERVFTNVTSKYAGKINLWLAISDRGVVGYRLFKQNMDSDLFINIIEENLVPNARRLYLEGYYLLEDNDPKHTSKKSKAAYERLNVRIVPWPPQSPDLNPIENVFGWMKRELDKKYSTTIDSLTSSIEEIIGRMTLECLTKFTSSFNNRLKECIKNKGNATTY